MKRTTVWTMKTSQPKSSRLSFAKTGLRTTIAATARNASLHMEITSLECKISAQMTSWGQRIVEPSTKKKYVAMEADATSDMSTDAWTRSTATTTRQSFTLLRLSSNTARTAQSYWRPLNLGSKSLTCSKISMLLKLVTMMNQQVLSLSQLQTTTHYLSLRWRRKSRSSANLNQWNNAKMTRISRWTLLLAPLKIQLLKPPEKTVIQMKVPLDLSITSLLKWSSKASRMKNLRPSGF